MEIATQFKNSIEDLGLLPQLKIPRFVSIDNFGEVEFHLFCVASKKHMCVPSIQEQKLKKNLFADFLQPNLEQHQKILFQSLY